MKLDYTITYSKRRQLSITVERDCSVRVLAPEGMDADKIHRLVDTKKPWIYSKINDPPKYAALPHAPGKELVNGESLLYLGRHYRIEWVETDVPDIRFERGFLLPRSQTDKGLTLLRHWYEEQATRRILPEVKHKASVMGIACPQTNIIDSRCHWGNCTPQDKLNFNWRLIKAPVYVIDYVVTHELAHLLESNHTPRFWNIVRTHAQYADKARLWLKTHGQLLEEGV